MERIEEAGTKDVDGAKYRHIYGQTSKRELYYKNIRVTNNGWDSNLLKCNSKFISVIWNSPGGGSGAFAILRADEVGRTPDHVSLFRGHKGQVLDLSLIHI